MDPASYCGAPPLPGEWLGRWNLDPVLIAVWLGVAAIALWQARRRHVTRAQQHGLFAGGSLALAVWISPLCALGVALFGARVGQHMLLVLVVAPLLAWSWPTREPAPGVRAALAAWTLLTLASWLWHAPVPYEATFRSTLAYWAMHVSLLVGAVATWRVLLDPSCTPGVAPALALATCFQMSALGALITFAPGPLYTPHVGTTAAFGLSVLEDQQLGGLILWIPGCIAFLLAGVASVARLVRTHDAPAQRALL